MVLVAVLQLFIGGGTEWLFSLNSVPSARLGA